MPEISFPETGTTPDKRRPFLILLKRFFLSCWIEKSGRPLLHYLNYPETSPPKKEFPPPLPLSFLSREPREVHARSLGFSPPEKQMFPLHQVSAENGLLRVSSLSSSPFFFFFGTSFSDFDRVQCRNFFFLQGGRPLCLMPPRPNLPLPRGKLAPEFLLATERF